ncbi:MAG TPA: hypothetical protein VG847_04500 [Chitinophagaceae bacterium]|nr:hypothetical protein [Chitinophagaceae bacterium]
MIKRPLKVFLFIGLVVFFSSCQKEYSIDSNSTTNFDPDTWAFIQNSGITDSAEQTALNNLVAQLKYYSLWQKFYAIYPLVGGTAATTKWNLKDPRDLDAAYRLTFSGSPVFTLKGVLFPTPTDYADTHFNDSTFIYNSNSISYYSGTQNTVSGYDMGCTDSGGINNEFTIYHCWDSSNWFGYYDFSPKPSNTVGLFMISATSSNVTRYDNGVFNNSSGPPRPGPTKRNILIGSVYGAPLVGQRRCEFATIGQGFSDSEAQILSNIVQNFELSLGR